MGINRNIVECKYAWHSGSNIYGWNVLIETLWNVNLILVLMSLNCLPVLIETLWNVNTKYSWTKIKGEQVLIETLWNVNTLSTILQLTDMCINRNIVECKCSGFHGHTSRLLVLIETLWNVNQQDGSIIYYMHNVLIETLWNVNIISKSPSAMRSSINRNIVECKSQQCPKRLQ